VREVRDELTYSLLSHLARSQARPEVRGAQSRAASGVEAGAGRTR